MSAPSRVLMTADTIGGVWVYALELARALAPHGVQVTLATMGAPASEAQRREAGEVENLDLLESVYRLEWMDDPWEDVERAGGWLLDLQARVQPDIIHLNGYAHGVLEWDAPCVVVAHSCVLSWWRAVKSGSAPPWWNRYRDAVTRGLADADAVIAPTRAMAGSLAANFSMKDSVRVIFNGRDASSFAPRLKQPFILTAGRVWDEAKNIAALAAVAPNLPWPIRAAGDVGSSNGGIEYLGRLSSDALAQQFAAASIYALPARYEPFGLSVVEAALCGCALVLGDIPSLRELWEDAALFVAPDDLAALRHALQELIGDGQTREHFAARAQERASHFTPERMAQGYLEVYSELQAQRALAGGVAT